MKANQVPHDSATESLLFQLNVNMGKLDRANVNMRNVLKSQTASQYT